MVLKVTNDREVRAPLSPTAVVPAHRRLFCAQCLKFQTDQQQDIKRFEKLNDSMLMQMCGKNPREAEEQGAHLPDERSAHSPNTAHAHACAADGAKPEGRPKSSEDAGGSKRRKGRR